MLDAATAAVLMLAVALICQYAFVRFTLVARRPLSELNACQDNISLSSKEKLVWFMRHGQSMGNAARKVAEDADKARGDGKSTAHDAYRANEALADAPLTLEGQRQAREVAVTVSAWRERPDLIVCSSMTRAIMTAALVFEEDIARGVPLVVRPELREFFPGLMEDRGRPLAALRTCPSIISLPNFPVIAAALSDRSTEGWRAAWDGGQACGPEWRSHVGCGARIDAFKVWLAQQPARRVATVSHWGTVNNCISREPRAIEASGRTLEKLLEKAHVLTPQEGWPVKGSLINLSNCGWVAAVFEPTWKFVLS